MEEKKKLLIVDDDPLMVRTIRGWLAEEYNVSVVTSGKTASVRPINLTRVAQQKLVKLKQRRIWRELWENYCII